QRVALLIPQAVRRALEELAPELPKQLGGGSIKTLTRGLLWAALGADLSEKFQLNLVAQADSADDARQLQSLGRAAVAAGVKQARLPAELAELLNLKVDDSRVELTLAGKAIDQSLLLTIGRMRESASRAQSTNNLKQLALAFHNYHDVHKTF